MVVDGLTHHRDGTEDTNTNTIAYISINFLLGMAFVTKVVPFLLIIVKNDLINQTFLPQLLHISNKMCNFAAKIIIN